MSEDTPSAERQEEIQPSAPGWPVGRIALGVVLLLIGILWILDAAGLATLRWGIVLPGILTVIGVALLASVRRGAHGGLVATGIVLSVLVLASAIVPITAPLAGIGDRAERPTSVAEAEEGFELGMGKLTVDLRGVDEWEDDATITASVGAGELQVRLPRGVGAQIEASAGMGEVVVLGRSQGGLGVSVTEQVRGDPVVVLELSVGMGMVEVQR
jgi:hypothetical protein